MFQIVTRKPQIEEPLQVDHASTDLLLPPGVHLGDLLTPDFLTRHSPFAAEDEMFVASGFKIECAQDFADIPDDDWDRFIEDNTSFASWRDLLQAAYFEWLARTPVNPHS